jgi:hypothetical protein
VSTVKAEEILGTMLTALDVVDEALGLLEFSAPPLGHMIGLAVAELRLAVEQSVAAVGDVDVRERAAVHAIIADRISLLTGAGPQQARTVVHLLLGETEPRLLGGDRPAEEVRAVRDEAQRRLVAVTLTYLKTGPRDTERKVEIFHRAATPEALALDVSRVPVSWEELPTFVRGARLQETDDLSFRLYPMEEATHG